MVHSRELELKIISASIARGCYSDDHAETLPNMKLLQEDEISPATFATTEGAEGDTIGRTLGGQREK